MPAVSWYDEPRDVRADQDELAVVAVRPHARRQGEQRERQELRGRDDRHVAHVAADGEHRERQHDAGHPVAQDRQHLPGEEQPVLRLVAQHRGQARAQAPWRRRRGWFVMAPRSVAASAATRQRSSRPEEGRDAGPYAGPGDPRAGRAGVGRRAARPAARPAAVVAAARLRQRAALPAGVRRGRGAPGRLPVAGGPAAVPVHHQAGPARQLPVRDVRRPAGAGVPGARLVRYDGPPDGRRLHGAGHHAPGRP